jgi:hypothetical protein
MSSGYKSNFKKTERGKIIVIRENLLPNVVAGEEIFRS